MVDHVVAGLKFLGQAPFIGQRPLVDEEDPYTQSASALRSISMLHIASPGEVIVECVHTEAAFSKLADEWRELLTNSQADTLFLTWEWLFTWWKHFGSNRQLHLVCVRGQDRRLIALLPLALRPRQPGKLLPFRSLEFLGAGIAGSDYLDVILRKGKESLGVEALVRYLAGCGYTLEMRQVIFNSAQALRLAEALQGQGWCVQHTNLDVCPYIDLHDLEWGSYLAGLGASHRQNVRRRLRNLHRHFKVTFEQVKTEFSRKCAFSTLVMLHRKRWAERRESDALGNQKLVAFQDEFSRIALERDWLRLYVLNLNGRPAASLYGFKYQKKVLFYQSGFDPLLGNFSIGLVTLALAIRSALADGAVEFDLLHGNEAYKFLWAHHARHIMRVDAYPAGIRGVVPERIMAMRRGLKRIIGNSCGRTFGGAN